MIELLVVVLIIAILAAVALPKYQAAVLKARISSTLPSIATLAQAAELYYMGNGVYPPDTMDGMDVSSLSGCSYAGYGLFECGSVRYDYNGGESFKGKEHVRSGWLNPNGKTDIMILKFMQYTDQYPAQTYCIVPAGSSIPDIATQVCKSMSGRSSPNASVLAIGASYLLP